MKELGTLLLDFAANAALLLIGAMCAVGLDSSMMACFVFSLFFLAGYQVSEFLEMDPQLSKRMLFLVILGALSGRFEFVFLFPIASFIILFAWGICLGIYGNIQKQVKKAPSVESA